MTSAQSGIFAANFPTFIIVQFGEDVNIAAEISAENVKNFAANAQNVTNRAKMYRIFRSEYLHFNNYCAIIKR